MNDQARLYEYNTLEDLVTRLRNDLNNKDFLVLYAYNGTGKTRLSMAFKEIGKQPITNQLVTDNGDTLVDDNGDHLVEEIIQSDTLYFNAYTEDLFSWDNDLENDTERVLVINSDSKFFRGFRDMDLEEKIFFYLQRYVEFEFRIDYDHWKISFSKKIKKPDYREGSDEPEYITKDNIKISRGEENIFIWCIFLAICELTIDGAEAYEWVKYIYIDDPISSLDDNNAICVASDLAKVLKRGIGKVKTVISSHHNLFYNVMCNEFKQSGSNRYFLFRNQDDKYSLQKTSDTPFFQHVALLSELKIAADSGNIKTYHFNVLRSIFEKTSSFFGFNSFGKCIHGLDDEILYNRALNLLSHGAYSIYDPVDLNEDNKNLFKKILEGFLDKYKFELPLLLREEHN